MLLSVGLAGADIHVASAGTRALVGSKMDPRLAKRLAEAGLAPDEFVSRQVTPEMLRAADLVLTATREHRSLVVRMQPGVLRRTYALADFADLAAHLLQADPQRLEGAEIAGDGLVRRISETASRSRGEVRARTRDEADIIDPFRQPDKVLGHMVGQVGQLLPPIISVFISASELRSSVAERE